jgi:hypothetical protein
MSRDPLPCDEHLRVPRVRAVHLIVVVALSGGLLAADFTISAMQTQTLRNSPTAQSLNVDAIVSALIPGWTRLLRAFTIPGFAAALVGSAVLLRQKRRRASSALQPGHWLVLSLALGGALAAIARPFELLDLVLFYSQRWPSKVLVAVALLNVVAVGAIRGVAAVRLRDGWQWRLLLALCAASALQGLFLLAVACYPSSRVWSWMPVLAWLLPCWWAFLLLTGAAVAIIDWPHWGDRDWAHWLGVSLWTLYGTATLLLVLAAPWALGISRAPAKHATGSGEATEALRAKGPAYRRIDWKADDFFADPGAISLCEAIEAKDLAAIARLANSGVNVNARGRGNMTPLLWAFPVGEDVFAKLLDLGADPNVRLTERVWPLLFEKDASVMSASASPLVLEPGPTHESYFGRVPMENYLRLVLEHGGNPNAEDAIGRTPLFYAHTPESIAELLRFGADIEHRDRTGFTALYSEIAGRSSGGALALLKAGADYRIAEHKGWDVVLRLERDKMEVEKKRRGAWDEWAERSAAPVRGWLANEGVNWQAARAALESREAMNGLKNLPADYKNRPWLPQRPTLKKPDAEAKKP